MNKPTTQEAFDVDCHAVMQAGKALLQYTNKAERPGAQALITFCSGLEDGLGMIQRFVRPQLK